MAPAARPCPACDGPHAAFAFRVADYDHVRCRGCGTLYVTPVPGAQAIEAHYLAPDYHRSADAQGARMRAEGDARAATLRRFGVRTVLEVGCGPGHFLDACRDLNIRVEGVDRAPLRRRRHVGGHRARS